MHKMSLRTHADIVAAAAPIIGFAPTNSIVAYMLRNDPVPGTVVLCGIRFDVTITLEQAANLPQTVNLTRINPDAAILLAICDAELDEHAHTVLDTLRDALSSVEIPVTRRIMTRDVTTPGTWHDIDTGQHGAYPCAVGPRSNSSSTRAFWSAVKRGGRPARPASTNAALPSSVQVRYQRDTLCRLTFNRRATSACGTPLVNNFAASRRRRASASKSRR